MKVRERVRAGLLLLLGSVAVAATSSASAIDFDDEGWELSGEGTVVEEVDGKLALRVAESGRAIYREADFRDGTIEFDLRHSEYRSFIFVEFRMASDREYEEFYLRAHKSNLPDAVQYTPVFRGSSQWQLFHDEHATAPVGLDAGAWTRVRIIVKGEQAVVFVGDAEEPQLVVPRLAREAVSGPIALVARQPGRGFTGRPDGVDTAHFSNLRISSGTEGFDFSKIDAPEPVTDRIESWELSAAFDPGEGPVVAIPEEVTSGAFRTVKADPSGRVLLAREVAKPEGVRRASVLARTTLSAESPRTVRLDFGYSDEVSVFLNGRLLFSGNDSYSFNLPRRQGLLTIDQGTLYLPLEAGENELVLAVTDVFGGWGLTGRLVEP